MKIEKRPCEGGRDGFSIFEQITFDDNGVIVSRSFVVYGRDGKPIDSFSSLDEVITFLNGMLDDYEYSPPRRGM
jgi:hypothetical protein